SLRQIYKHRKFFKFHIRSSSDFRCTSGWSSDHFHFNPVHTKDQLDFIQWPSQVSMPRQLRNWVHSHSRERDKELALTVADSRSNGGNDLEIVMSRWEVNRNGLVRARRGRGKIEAEGAVQFQAGTSADYEIGNKRIGSI